jgi:hypothetical protein
VDEYRHHQVHPFNILMGEYNEFVRLVFRSLIRQDPGITTDTQAALKLAKRLGLSPLINKPSHLVKEYLRDRENNAAIKEKIVMNICKVMQLENQLNDEFIGSKVFRREVDT